jgi:hypothetical protein
VFETEAFVYYAYGQVLSDRTAFAELRQRLPQEGGGMAPCPLEPQADKGEYDWFAWFSYARAQVYGLAACVSLRLK